MPFSPSYCTSLISRHISFFFLPHLFFSLVFSSFFASFLVSTSLFSLSFEHSLSCPLLSHPLLSSSFSHASLSPSFPLPPSSFPLCSPFPPLHVIPLPPLFLSLHFTPNSFPSFPTSVYFSHTHAFPPNSTLPPPCPHNLLPYSFPSYPFSCLLIHPNSSYSASSVPLFMPLRPHLTCPLYSPRHFSSSSLALPFICGHAPLT